MSNEYKPETDKVSYLTSCEASLTAIIEAMSMEKKKVLENESKATDSLITLPFLPITVPKESIKSLWLNLGKFMVNEGNSSSLDLIVDTSAKVTRAVIHHADKGGLIKSQEEIPLNKLPFPQFSQAGEKVELYDKLNDAVKSYSKSDLGTIRVVPKELLEKSATLYTAYQSSDKSNNLFALIGEYINLIMAYLEESKLIIYPLPILLEFLQKFQTYLGIASYYEVLQKIGQMLPRQKFTLTFWDAGIYLSFTIVTDNSSFIVDTVSLPPTVTNPQQIVEKNSKILHYLRKTYRCRHNFVFHLPEYTEVAEQVLTTELPISLSRITSLVQQNLNFQRKVGHAWDVYPKPQLYDPTFKFWTKSFGFLFNPNKISYWAFPEMVHNAMVKEFGLNSKILFMFEPTISANSSILADKNVKAVIISLVNGVIEEITALSAEKIDGSLPRTQESGKKDFSIQIKAFREAIMPTSGRISHTVWINFDLLQQLAGINLLWAHKTQMGYFKILKVLRTIRSAQAFQILPTPLAFVQMKKIPPAVLFYRLGGILSDSIDF